MVTTEIFMVLDGLFEVMILVLEEAEIARDILPVTLYLLALLDNSLDVHHDLAVNFFIADLFLEASLEHFALLL
jgi:hypothetical protein